MNLLNIYKKTIATIFSEPAIAMFFMLYIISSSFLGGVALSTKTSFNALVMVFCFFVFALCFISGWLEIIKESAKTPQFREDKSHWGVFLEGIGKNIVSLGIGLFIYLALFIFAIT